MFGGSIGETLGNNNVTFNQQAFLYDWEIDEWTSIPEAQWFRIVFFTLLTKIV